MVCSARAIGNISDFLLFSIFGRNCKIFVDMANARPITRSTDIVSPSREGSFRRERLLLPHLAGCRSDKFPKLDHEEKEGIAVQLKVYPKIDLAFRHFLECVSTRKFGGLAGRGDMVSRCHSASTERIDMIPNF